MLSHSRLIFLTARCRLERYTPLFNRPHSGVFKWRRTLSTESPTVAPASESVSASPPTSPPPLTDTERVYYGPMSKTFRHLKIFSLSSLTFSFTMAPFMFIIESNLNTTARLALAATALTTSGISTALVAWCGKPYVTTLRRRSAASKEAGDTGNPPVEEIELTTLTLGLHPRITRVYDPEFLVETNRPFAKWELANRIVLSETAKSKLPVPGQEETVAETMDKKRNVLGRWIVTWGENGEGTCREVGSVIRYFNVHEELLR